jgi:polyhydroxybutyrate depolymerase
VSDAVENIGVPDVRFIAKLLRVLANRYEIDATRVYAAGISNGGMMAYRLACRLADRIAAVASVGAGMLGIVCEPLRPVSVIQFHGTLDPGWPYDGGPSCFAEDVFPPAVATIDEWRRIDDCTAPPIITYQVGAATCTTSGGCATGAEVVFCTIEGGGHTWAGGRSSLGEQILRWDGSCVYGRGSGVGTVSRDISATDEMWRFFERHRLPP